MGCDMHVHVERKNAKGAWEPVYSKLIPCSHCKGTLLDSYNSRCANCGGREEAHDPNTGRCLLAINTKQMVYRDCYCKEGWAPPGQEEVWTSRVYQGRDSALFGVLGGVRGSSDADFTQKGRGVPDDASLEYKRAAAWSDAHNHTWYTLTELECRSWREFPTWLRTMRALRKIDKETDNVRVLIFFDN